MTGGLGHASDYNGLSVFVGQVAHGVSWSPRHVQGLIVGDVRGPEVGCAVKVWFTNWQRSPFG